MFIESQHSMLYHVFNFGLELQWNYGKGEINLTSILYETNKFLLRLVIYLPPHINEQFSITFLYFIISIELVHCFKRLFYIFLVYFFLRVHNFSVEILQQFAHVNVFVTCSLTVVYNFYSQSVIKIRKHFAKNAVRRR